MPVRYPNSYLKNFSQIRVVASQKFSVEGKIATPPKRFQVGDSFWRKYGCYLGCGGCCLAFSLDYLPREFEQFCSEYPELEYLGKKRLINVNGRSFPLWTIENENRQWCQFLNQETGACGVHRANPFSCKVELIKFRINKDIGYMLKAPFGRAWNMERVDGGEILCDFSEFSSEQFWRNDLPTLRKMKAWADYFAIQTHLGRLIDSLILCVETGKFALLPFEN